MSWGSWQNFWEMGGHGAYVWGSYGIALAIIVIELVVLALRRRSILDHLGRLARWRQHGERKRHESKA